MGLPSDCFTASVPCWTRSDPHRWPTHSYHKNFASDGQWQQVVVGGLLPPVLSPLLPASLLSVPDWPLPPSPLALLLPQMGPLRPEQEGGPFQPLNLRGTL